MNVTGWRCAVCETDVGIETALPWTCPGASAEDRHHVLHLVRRIAPLRPTDHPNPFVAYDAELAWAAFAEVHGMNLDARTALVETLDDAIASVAGVGFRATPLWHAHALSSALGFAPTGGVWVKDDTGNVAGSHKARHLFTILLHVLAAEQVGRVPWRSAGDRPPLAIASCGNAALAAATLASAVEWPIAVFVPPWAAPSVVSQLEARGAAITVCPRFDSDPPGDPSVHRFREAVAAGAVPFIVQGPENALCLDGGRTLGWEITETLGHVVDRIVVQVGGGALAACVGAACNAAGVHPRIHTVQTEGCAPLVRAWELAGGQRGLAAAGGRWDELMWPWESEPQSAAEGILDDETYDWLGAFEAMVGGGGSAVVASEEIVVRAHELSRSSTDVRASATGTAGLAGLLALRDEIADDERVVVIFSGTER